ncbi:MAG: hypothetical protein QM599_12415 [Pseudoxanthomonas sp.]
MKYNRIVYALIIAGAVAVTGCKKKEEAAPPPPPPPPAPVEQPAPAAEAAPAPAASFTVSGGAASDKISVVVTTDASVPAAATINAKLTYQDGQTAGEQTTQIKAEDNGTTTIDFTKASPWPTGKYTAAVTLNGAPVGTPQEVEIK